MIGLPGSLRYLSLAEILDLHGRVIAQSGGMHGLRDLGLLENVGADRAVRLGNPDVRRVAIGNLGAS